MFGNILIKGNERTIAEQYVGRVGGDAQLQQIFEALLNEADEYTSGREQEIEGLKVKKDGIESDFRQLRMEYKKLSVQYEKIHAHWLSIGGDLL